MIAVEHLSKRFGDVTVLRDVSVEIKNHQAKASRRGGTMFQAERPDWRTNCERHRTPVERSSVVKGRKT